MHGNNLVDAVMGLAGLGVFAWLFAALLGCLRDPEQPADTINIGVPQALVMAASGILFATAVLLPVLASLRTEVRAQTLLVERAIVVGPGHFNTVRHRVQTSTDTYAVSERAEDAAPWEPGPYCASIEVVTFMGWPLPGLRRVDLGSLPVIDHLERGACASDTVRTRRTRALVRTPGTCCVRWNTPRRPGHEPHVVSVAV